MSLACREQELDALLAGELSLADTERVRAHIEGCAACTHALAWLKLERGWMTQRARRVPARPALSFEALEARLAAAKQAPARPESARRSNWSYRGVMALGAAAAMAFIVFGVVQARPVNAPEELWSRSQDVLASGLVQACVDPSGDAVAALEDRFSACLIATPAWPAD